MLCSLLEGTMTFFLLFFPLQKKNNFSFNLGKKIANQYLLLFFLQVHFGCLHHFLLVLVLVWVFLSLFHKIELQMLKRIDWQPKILVLFTPMACNS